MLCQHARTGRFVFLFAQDAREPVSRLRQESRWQTAPAGVAGQDGLFLLCRSPALTQNLGAQGQRGDIGVDAGLLGFRPTRNRLAGLRVVACVARADRRLHQAADHVPWREVVAHVRKVQRLQGCKFVPVTEGWQFNQQAFEIESLQVVIGRMAVVDGLDGWSARRGGQLDHIAE